MPYSNEREPHMVAFQVPSTMSNYNCWMFYHDQQLGSFQIMISVTAHKDNKVSNANNRFGMVKWNDWFHLAKKTQKCFIDSIDFFMRPDFCDERTLYSSTVKGDISNRIWSNRKLSHF